MFNQGTSFITLFTSIMAKIIFNFAFPTQANVMNLTHCSQSVHVENWPTIFTPVIYQNFLLHQFKFQCVNRILKFVPERRW